MRKRSIIFKLSADQGFNQAKLKYTLPAIPAFAGIAEKINII